MAFVLTLNFDYEINTSLQIGDQVYHTTTPLLGGFEQNDNLSGGQIHIGTVYSILSPFQIEVYSKYTDANGNPLTGIEPEPDDYISFSKNRISSSINVNAVDD